MYTALWQRILFLSHHRSSYQSRLTLGTGSPAMPMNLLRRVKMSRSVEKAVIIDQEGSEDGEMKSECIDIDQGNIDGEFTLDALLHCDNFPINHNQSHLPHSHIRSPKTMSSLEGHNIQNSDEKFPAELLTPSEDSHSFEKSKAAESDENNTKLITVSGTGNTVSDHEAKNAAFSSSESGFLTTRKKNRITRLHYDENHYPGSRNVAPKCFKSERRKSCTSTSYGNAAKDDSSGNRKALSERSPNVVQHSEVTGKWKCPQRSKPVMGPPLKQLGLEKWLSRL
ncbi:unnamed protein product [Linum trigynum]|uniref:Uncharacterized protein n=1 Tax=Linum trigynum TaxID=586398 RepID=A0AAV2FUH3_9ROSI